MSDIIAFSETQIQAIKGLNTELSGSMTRAEAERDFQKEAIKAISKEHEIPKVLLKKITHKIKQSQNLKKSRKNFALEIFISINQNKFHQQIVNILFIIELKKSFEF